jgi:AcrR family transcriptional regulator
VYNHHVIQRTSLEPAKAPGISTHERILRVAKTLFANRGYEHTSTSAIARQAGTSESQLMKHFGSKAGLLEAIFIEGWSEITEEARAAIDGLIAPIDRLQAITRCVLDRLERDPELKLLLLLEGRRIRKEGQMVALTEGFMSFVALVDSVLQEMTDAHMLRANLNPQAVRSALMGMLEGMLRDRFLSDRLGFPANFDLGQLQEVLSLVLASFMQRQASSIS